VVPVAVRGTDRVLPAKSSYLQGGDVSVRIGEPIPTAGLDIKDRKRLTEEIEARVRQLYAGDGAASLRSFGPAVNQ
jgi:1-acyl-sn-glycerol-3-phosphate acyltransferase